MMRKIVRIAFVLVFFSVGLYAGKIDRAYEALNVYDYFKAKTLFEELVKKEPVAANYGLGVIFYRDDNPFHSLNAAYIKINLAEEAFKLAKSKEKEDLLEFSIDSIQISKLKNEIITAYWDKVKGTKDIDELNVFISKYPDYASLDEVVKYRNDIAFATADSLGTFQSYREFYTTYPDDPRAETAKKKYESILYKEKTQEGTLQCYIDFVNIYPDNSYVELAQKNIFLLSTEKGTIDSFRWFIKKFPDNKYVSQAWKNIFVLSFTDFNDSEIHDFIENNHDFTYPDMLSEARTLRDMHLLRIAISEKWGYADYNGDIKIRPQYVFENDFYNGLALVANDDFVGYIDKKGNQVVDFKYDDGSDFVEGVAHVVIGDSVAMINKLGVEVLGFDYSYISDCKDNVVLAKNIHNNKYSFYDKDGDPYFGARKFDYAEQFEDSLAIVGVAGKYGVINRNGDEILPLSYNRVLKGCGKDFIVENKVKKYGIVSAETRDTLVSFKYDYIARPSEGKYPVFLKTKYGYLNSKGKKMVALKLNRFDGDTTAVSFKRGFALTEYRNKQGLIDSLGHKVFPNIFDKIGEAIDFPIPASKRGKWGYVTNKITLWLPYKYDYAGPFIDGRAIVSYKGDYGMIDIHKKTVLDFKYSYLENFDKEFLIAKQNNFFGLIDKSGTEVLPFYYSKIEEYKKGILRLYLLGEYQYYDLVNKKFIYGVLPAKNEPVESADSLKVN